jgi:hypothetical protein
MSEILILADEGRRVWERREDTASDQEAVWVTQRLNRHDSIIAGTLQRVSLYYQAKALVTIQLRASKDGGRSFPITRTMSLPATQGLKKGKVTTWFDLTGRDLRLMVRIPPESVEDLIILHLHPEVAFRGENVLTPG